VKDILRTALEKIQPNNVESEKLFKIIDNLIETARKINDSNFKTILVGSIAKGTFLKHADIDLFLVFDKEVDLKQEGLNIAKTILPNGRELYAQHPYIRGNIEGIDIDLVPCYSIQNASQPISAVDRTPYHTEWVKNNISNLANDIRLTKQFLKGIGAYGANAAVGGFSGYLVEVLCIKFGGFEEFINNVAKWRPPIKLGNVKGAPESPITLPDPVDEKRNVAAGVTLRGLGSAILGSKAFIKNPSIEFFFPKNKSRIPKGSITTIILEHPGGNEETALPWLQRQGRKIYKAVRDFEPIAWNVNLGKNGFIVLETATTNLPSIVPHKGPAPWEDGAIEFLKKYPDASLTSERLEIGKPPRNSNIKDVILELLPDAKVKSGLIKGAEPAQRVPWLN